jgi:hypothetical protein
MARTGRRTFLPSAVGVFALSILGFLGSCGEANLPPVPGAAAIAQVQKHAPRQAALRGRGASILEAVVKWSQKRRDGVTPCWDAMQIKSYWVVKVSFPETREGMRIAKFAWVFDPERMCIFDLDVEALKDTHLNDKGDAGESIFPPTLLDRWPTPLDRWLFEDR